MDELPAKLADYALAAMFVSALTVSTALTMLVKATTFPLMLTAGAAAQLGSRKRQAKDA